MKLKYVNIVLLKCAIMVLPSDEPIKRYDMNRRNYKK